MVMFANLSSCEKLWFRCAIGFGGKHCAATWHHWFQVFIKACQQDQNFIGEIGIPTSSCCSSEKKKDFFELSFFRIWIFCPCKSCACRRAREVIFSAFHSGLLNESLRSNQPLPSHLLKSEFPLKMAIHKCLANTRCQIWCTIELHRDPILKVLSEW